MRVLVDTHVLLWVNLQSRRLSSSHKQALASGANESFFSAASIWEIAIKSQLKRPDFNADPALVMKLARESGMSELPVTSAVAARVVDLPLHHADPFDRLLIAQAIEGSLTLLTVDSQLARYSDLVRLL